MSDWLGLEDLHKMLNVTESLKPTYLPMGGDKGKSVFALPQGWNVGLKEKDDLEVTEATVYVEGEGKELMLSKEAALGIAHAVGLSPAYVMKTPGVLIQSHLNYWATYSPDLSLKVLTNDDAAMVLAKDGIMTFSNQHLLEKAVDTVMDNLALSEIMVDAKSDHGLHVTHMRLVFETEWTTKEGNTWFPGVQITNSLTGKYPLSVQGYWYSSNADSSLIVTREIGKYNRKTMGQDWGEVIDWVGKATTEVINGFEHDFSIIDSLHDENVGGALDKVLADIFRTYKVPLKVRRDVIDNMVESGSKTYYGIVEAIMKTANIDDLPGHFITNIMEVAGDVAEHAHEHCESCMRVFV